MQIPKPLGAQPTLLAILMLAAFHGGTLGV